MKKFWEKTLEYSIKTVIGVSAAVIIYTTCLFGLDYYSTVNSPIIKDKEHAKRILQKKKKELNIENKDIEVVFGDTYFFDPLNRPLWTIKDGKHKIFLPEDNRNIAILCHELYHIAKNHKDMKKHSFRYFFYEEPLAALYALRNKK